MIIFDSTFLENFKDAIIKSNINKTLIKNLKDNLMHLSNSNSNNIRNNNLFSSNLEALSKNNKEIEQFLFSIIPVIEEYIKSEVSRNLHDDSRDNSSKSNTNDSAVSKIDSTGSDCNHNNLVENTLIISEIQKTIILPYYISDLEKISSSNDNMSFDEIIKQKYTLPISFFKSFAFSRFREAFKLARNKAHKSLKFSFDLAMELLFNYNLHPAIIAACRNLDELDIYLDYLDSGETNKFDCFNIKFEVPPVVQKQKTT